MQQSKEECQFLINLAKPHMAKSTVVDSATGKSTDSRFIFAATASCLCDHIVFACLRGVVPDFQNLCVLECGPALACFSKGAEIKPLGKSNSGSQILHSYLLVCGLHIL